MNIKNLLMISLLVLSGCASTENVPANYALGNQSDKGVLLASVTYHGSYSGYAIQYRKIGSAKWHRLQVGSGTAFLPPGMLTWDIEAPGLRGNVFAVELAEGEYEFASWKVFSGVAQISPANVFSVQFNLSPGKAVYAGNFHFIRESGFGATVTGVNVNYVDEFDRDINIARKKYAFLKEASVHNNAEDQKVSKLGDGNSTVITPILYFP